jgi:hypothetical protein
MSAIIAKPSLVNNPKQRRFPSNAATAPLLCGLILPIGRCLLNTTAI